jgi:hypothetical protein
MGGFVTKTLADEWDKVFRPNLLFCGKNDVTVTCQLFQSDCTSALTGDEDNRITLTNGNDYRLKA